jgi:hypothetical protein
MARLGSSDEMQRFVLFRKYGRVKLKAGCDAP